MEAENLSPFKNLGLVLMKAQKPGQTLTHIQNWWCKANRLASITGTIKSRTYAGTWQTVSKVLPRVCMSCLSHAEEALPGAHQSLLRAQKHAVLQLGDSETWGVLLLGGFRSSKLKCFFCQSDIFREETISVGTAMILFHLKQKVITSYFSNGRDF